MNSNVQSSREIKENLGRGKAYLNKQEPLKGIASICEALKIYSPKKLFGQEKIEIEYFISEVVQIISQLQILVPYLPPDFQYTRGQEKKLYNTLVQIIRSVAQELNKDGPEQEEDNSAEIKKRKLLEKMEAALLSGKKLHSSSHIKKLVEEHGETKEIYYNIAHVHYQAGMYKEALTYIKKALQKDPEDISSYRIAINSLRKLKEYEKAESLFQQAINKFGEHSNIYINMARLYWEWNKPEKAEQAADKALSLDPDNQETAQIISDIKLWVNSKLNTK